MFPTYNLRETDRTSQRKLPKCCLVSDLVETGEWLIKVDGSIPACSVSRFTFLQEGEWHPITKLPVHYDGGYPSYSTTAVLKFDDQSLGNVKVEVVRIMEKKRNDQKYQQLIALQKPFTCSDSLQEPN